MNTTNVFGGWPARAAVLLLSLLAACGGGGGGGAEPEPVLQGNFFPLAVGDRWVYTDGLGGAPFTVRATETRRVDGQDGIVVVTEDPMNGTNLSVYVVSASAVRQVPASSADPLMNAIGPLDVMRFPLHAGDHYVPVDRTIDTGMDFDGDGRMERATVRFEVQVIGLETATTPIGSFPASLHQRTTLTVGVQLTSVPQTVSVVTTVDDWYAPDIGPVRSTIVITSQGMTETQSMALAGYRVGTRSSDTVAPMVLSVSPPDGGSLRPDGPFTATFSETMEWPALVAATTLTAASGQTVALGYQVQGNTVTWFPNGGLVTGRYTAQIGTGATDLFGNPLAQPYRWSFDVDATGPVLLESTPADGATDVPLDSAIVLRFSEPLDPASLPAGTLWLTTSGTDVPFTQSVSGALLTLQPQSPLLRGQTYDLRIFGSVTDLAGNRMNTDRFVRFLASAGRFAAPVELAVPGLVDAVATGDVNGDGRADLVFSTGYTFDAAQDFKLLVRLQQADGSLAAAQVLDTRAEYVCPARSVVIGDLDGDGRNDLLLGADGCGIQVFRQGSDGVLRAASFIDSTVSGRLRLADFNRDGRLDLASSGYYGTRLQVWLQAADGSWVPHAAPAFDYAGGGDLDIGDVNGDGHADLVASSASGNAACAIGVVLQNADGSFAPVLCRAVLPADNVRAVAVGDISGDGRDDIVVTYGGNGAGKLGVLRQQADGSLGAPAALDSYEIPSQVEITDLNADGRRDVVVAHNGWMAITVHLQQPDGTLGAEIRYPGPYGNFNPGAMAVGDVNGDGRPDVVVAEALLLQRAVDPMAQTVRPWPEGGRATLLRRLLEDAAAR
ncbi:MAG: Ig-like domain-containing protein [Rubrivivax sp.]|nr:Ig-like domain-containing protein [Rubrivivax sp.]